MNSEHEFPNSFSRSRKWTLSANLLVMLTSALGLVIMFNYLAARHHFRWSWSESAQTKLSPLTETVLAGVTNPVKVTLYFRKDDPLYEMSWNLLKTYQFANERIQLESIDYDTQPGAAEVVKVRYQLGQKDRDMVIFEGKGGSKAVVYQGELSVLDLQPLLSGQSQEIRRTHFKGEALFTSAILTVINPRKPKAYFLEGHGEGNPDSEDSQLGYSRFATVLQENNVQVEKLNLAGPGQVPADCNLLIVAGPRRPLAPEVLEKIDRYLKQGGRMLALFVSYASVQKSCGLEDTLLDWGVAVGRDVVRDEKNFVSPDMADLVVPASSTHKIVLPLLGYQLYMVMPRSISKDRAAASGADAPQVDVLVVTAPSGHLIRDVRPGAVINPGEGDRRGSISLMVAVEKGGIRNVNADRGATRLVVAGDSLFLSNNNIDHEANHEFASYAINWLLARDELLVGVPPRPMVDYKLTMTAAQMTGVRWILMAAMPGVALVLGALVWLRRRR